MRLFHRCHRQHRPLLPRNRSNHARRGWLRCQMVVVRLEHLVGWEGEAVRAEGRDHAPGGPRRVVGEARRWVAVPLFRLGGHGLEKSRPIVQGDRPALRVRSALLERTNRDSSRDRVIGLMRSRTGSSELHRPSDNPGHRREANPWQQESGRVWRCTRFGKPSSGLEKAIHRGRTIACRRVEVPSEPVAWGLVPTGPGKQVVL